MLLLRITYKMVVDSLPELKLIRKCSLKSSFTYENAIKALNTLQSNASVLQQSKCRTHNESCLNLDETRKYMFRCGISMAKLNSLSVIHVAGTKGKGTTCALSESILRSHGYRTGFFSSPHLTCVTERIRLCGKPINRDVFVHYFETVYKSLENKKEKDDDMPPYFKFLTILAFKIFICENVDVAIIEVGIGGEHDCTNVLRNVSTVGITSLGIEHTAILGDTIEQIAWQKAGIIKPGCHAFTVPQEYPEAMQVLQRRADANNVSLTIVPEFNLYKFAENLEIQIDTEAQKLNLSLAIQLSNYWMQNNNLKIKADTIPLELPKIDMVLEVDKIFLRGINRLFWPGRYQITNWGSLKLYLDGAHTVESLTTCINWFKNKISLHSNPRILIFNATGDRNSFLLLEHLASNCYFNAAIFVPNAASAHGVRDDQINHSVPMNVQMDRCYEHQNIWNSINKSRTSLTRTSNFAVSSYCHKLKSTTESEDTNESSGCSSSQERFFSSNNKHIEYAAETFKQSNNREKIHLNNNLNKFNGSSVFSPSKCLNNSESYVFDNVYTSLNFLMKHFGSCDVLVTGSLHLIGAALVAIENVPDKS